MLHGRSVSSSPSLLAARGGGGWFSKDDAMGRACQKQCRSCSRGNRRGTGVRATVHDRVCRLFRRPGRMQDVTCLTISSLSSYPPPLPIRPSFLFPPPCPYPFVESCLSSPLPSPPSCFHSYSLFSLRRHTTLSPLLSLSLSLYALYMCLGVRVSPLCVTARGSLGSSADSRPRPRDCLPLAYRLMQLYVLRQFAPICV